MALDGIKVNHEALQTAADNMRIAVDDITRRLDQLEAELKPLQSDWAGSQQTAYYDAKRKWDTAMNDMKQLLTETHVAVTNSRSDYMTADENGAKRFM